MSVPSFPLSDVVDVVVQVSPLAVSGPTFNQGLIVGPSPVIPSVGGVSPRIRQYTLLSAMLSDGFTDIDPEYIAAELYFGQTPPPSSLWIGRQDLTAIQTAIPHSGAGGSGYDVGDTPIVTQSGGSGGQLTVLSVASGGVVTALGITFGNQGTGYSVGTGLATTGGHGIGLEVDITAIGETCLQAVQACRAASPQWYLVMVTDSIQTDHEAIAAWAQANTPVCVYFFTTSASVELTGASNSTLAYLKVNEYNRVFGLYSTTQGGQYPNNQYACAAAMGIAMGLNTGLAGSYFTMKFKILVGVSPEPLTQSELNVIEGNNGNVYISYAGGSYSWLEQGVVSDGQFFDEILNLDMLASNIQYNCVNVLTGNPAVPLTNAGEMQFVNAASQACATSASIGFIAGGVWEGRTVLGLETGDAVPNGFSIQFANFTTQTPAARAARQAMPLYVCIIEAGAAHSLIVAVLVQR